MGYADFLFGHNCSELLKHGISDEGMDVRPHWSDGTPAHTRKILHVCDRYNYALSGLHWNALPCMTMRRIRLENAIDEILWIYQKKSNRVCDLRSHIWDSWADESGTIGKAYGYQIGRIARHHKYTEADCARLAKLPSAQVIDSWVWLDQIDSVIYDLKYNPSKRSIMTDMYDPQDLSEMGLVPCAYNVQYSVTKSDDGLVLNSMLHQRSQDVLTANNWNAVQYIVLLHMLAQACGMKAGQFTHVIGDYHVYDRHLPIVTKMVENYWRHSDASNAADYPHPDPKFWVNPEVTDFYDFKVEDFALQDYRYEPFDYKIEVAI